MDETIINGEVFYKKNEVEINYTKNSDLPKETTTFTGIKFLSKDSCLMDETKVLGIASVKLGNNYVCCCLSTSFLEKVIKCLKMMSLLV